MYILFIEEPSDSLQEEIALNMPCILSDGNMLVPTDCEQDLIDLNIQYQVRTIK